MGIGGSTISDAARMIAVMMAEGITSEEKLRDLGLPAPVVCSVPTPLLNPCRCRSPFPPPSLPVSLTWAGATSWTMRPATSSGCAIPAFFANLIVLDSEMTVGTPDWLWLSTGVKALDHCIERLYCQGHQPATDAPVLMAAEILFNHLPRSRDGDGDLEARLQSLVAAWLSMMGAPNFAVGLSHALGHVIGVRYAVGHGYTSCVTQPYVMEYNRPVSAG